MHIKKGENMSRLIVLSIQWRNPFFFLLHCSFLVLVALIYVTIWLHDYLHLHTTAPCLFLWSLLQQELMEEMKVPSDAELMKVAISDLNNSSTTLEDRLRALHELNVLVEPIDNANGRSIKCLLSFDTPAFSYLLNAKP